MMEIFRVARSRTLIRCWPGIGKSLNAIDFPSGHHTGETSVLPSEVSPSALPPSTETRQISLKLENTIHLLSGDHRGIKTAESVNCNFALPSSLLRHK